MVFLCLAALVGLAMPAATKTIFYVAPTGNDANQGTRSKPFATLQRARAAVRMIGTATRRAVVVRGGAYEQTATFSLGPEDSGTKANPVVWRSAPGEAVRLVGGRSVPSTAFLPVDDSALLSRLDPAARGHVVCADLKSVGVSSLTPFPVAYRGAPPGPELFFNGQRMALARWPNQGWATIARILEAGSSPREGDMSGHPGAFEYSGDRPARWGSADGVWLQGYWCYDWCDEVIKIGAIDLASRRITLAVPHVYSIQQGNPSPRRYRALNLLEELESPGELHRPGKRQPLLLAAVGHRHRARHPRHTGNPRRGAARCLPYHHAGLRHRDRSERWHRGERRHRVLHRGV